ncbi:alpha/beta fold hydrolase [Actinacidiphila guanduensis]|uniref:Alpha/beta hydrolase family protein n=1 Tax=Actinacidiphila guanduensis TaxID=310781 RepID=A0A1H0LMA5_9ACTN|nr:alpha/beta hydrolase [Actinacidiphila guanduensis]SDO69255.1 Alpha/beta hydrolase family protein [Actinacidiphila guanduensis]
MSRYVLIPGAGGAAWYWHRVVPELRARGHEAVAVDLPGADASAGLPEYADKVAAAVGDREEAVVVAQSMGGFTAPMVCARAPVARLVLVNAMIPLPGETAGEWWEATGSQEARIAAAEAGGYGTEFDLDTYFLHDVPAEVAAEGAAHEGPEAEIAFGQPCAIERWPDVETRVVAAAGDRFFPAAFQRRVARERLGIDTDEVPGGHLAALSHPAELAERLVGYEG